MKGSRTTSASFRDRFDRASPARGSSGRSIAPRTDDFRGKRSIAPCPSHEQEALMFVRLSGIRNAMRSIAFVCAVTAIGGCTTTSDDIASIVEPQLSGDHAPAVQRAARAAAAPGAQFVARPRQRLLLIAKATVTAATAETYLTTQVFPVLAGSSRVDEVTTFVDAKGIYYVEIELKTLSPANLGLALDLLSAGSSQTKAQAIIDQLSKYFDITASLSL